MDSIYGLFVNSFYGLSLWIPFMDFLYVLLSLWTLFTGSRYEPTLRTLIMDSPTSQTLYSFSLYELSLWTLLSIISIDHFYRSSLSICSSIFTLSIDYLYGFFYGLSVEFFCRHTLWTLWILMDFVWMLHALPLSAVSIDSLSLYGFSLRTLSMDKLYRTLSLVLSINSLYRLSLATPVLVTSLFLRASGVHLNNQPDEYTLPDFAPLLLFISPLPASLMVFSSLSPPLVERSFYCRLLLLPFPLSPRFFPSPHPPLFPDNWKFMKSYV